MITFEDVRVEDHETYTVLPARVANDLIWFLQENDIHFFKINARQVIQNTKPPITSKFTVEQMTEIIQPFVEAGEDDFFPCIIASHLNSDDLTKKALRMIRDPINQDLEAFKREAAKTAESDLKAGSMHGR